jgi:TldD protein
MEMIPIESVRKILNEGLRRGGELSELYLEERESFTLVLDDGKLEKAVRGNDRGGGVRVFYGDTAAYAYTDDLADAPLVEAAQAASEAAKTSSEARALVDLVQRESELDFSIKRPLSDMDEKNKVDLLHQMDETARRQSKYVSQVRVGLIELHRGVRVYNSDGIWAEDDRTFIEFRIDSKGFGIDGNPGSHRFSRGRRPICSNDVGCSTCSCRGDDGGYHERLGRRAVP